MKPKPAEGEPKRPAAGRAEAGELTHEHKVQLLAVAREAIASYLRSGRLPDRLLPEPALNQMAGVFVTLRWRQRRWTQEGGLRGCVGRMDADLPLYQGVQQMAMKAAAADPRFSPLRLEELPDVRIEISVLTPPRRVNDLDEIEVGRDGLLIHHRGRRGVLLPKVAATRHWNRQQFLQQLCRKAGLPEDSWSRGAALYAFRAVDFGEDG